MQQKSYFTATKERKFEEGVLRADSCSDRYSLPRRYQYRNRFEDLVQYSFGRRALGQEGEVMRCAYYLKSLGFSPDTDEDIEGFVARHKDRLEKEVM